jgi:hypothetical protein
VNEAPLASPLVLALAHIYLFRLSEASLRQGLWQQLRAALQTVRGASSVGGKDSNLPPDFLDLMTVGKFQEIVAGAKRKICKKFALEPGIALNDALMENLYVVVICILNLIPVFVVGKPGSSKTLAMQVIVSNLQGEQSVRPFWRHFPAVALFPFQCSPMTQADGILHQFKMACNYAKHATKTRTVLLLDEVGLAEHSPDMPLKVLHGILVDPPISVVGISNWSLDAAKMNRAVCLQRPEPRASDLQATGESIVHAATTTAVGGGGGDAESGAAAAGGGGGKGLSSVGLSSVLHPLAAAYHTVYTQQQQISGGRDFVGMRDYCEWAGVEVS